MGQDLPPASCMAAAESMYAWPHIVEMFNLTRHAEVLLDVIPSVFLLLAQPVLQPWPQSCGL